MEQIKNYDVNAEIIPSEFGDITYYELLRDVIEKVNEMIKEWGLKDIELTTFINNITKQQNDFENAMKLLTSNFITNITLQQSTFENKITKQQNDFESTITLWQSEFENKFNGLYETFTSEINTTVTNFTTDMTNKYNNLSNEFKALKLYVETYLQSDEFKAQIVSEVDKYLNTPEFTQEIHDLVVQLISETGVIKINGNIELDNNKEYLVKDSTGVARNIGRIDSSDIVTLGTTDLPIELNTISSQRPRIRQGILIERMAFFSDLHEFTMLGSFMDDGIVLEASVNYPSGLTKDTSLVVGIELKWLNEWYFNGFITGSGSYGIASVCLRDSNISVLITGNMSSYKDISFRVRLRKKA